MIYTIFNSPLGNIVVSTDGESITIFKFEGQQYYSAPPKDWVKDSQHPLLVKAQKQTEEYFAGKRKAFDLPVAPEGTEFQKQVWKALEKIPFGQVTSYGKIAQQLGNPKAVRAVGAANGKNPVCIIVPCHRVLGANGSLIGYAGGIERKEKLLQLEGILIKLL